jgi:hypothetical protein
MGMFSLKELNGIEDKELYRVEASNRFAASEDLDNEVNINNAIKVISVN